METTTYLGPGRLATPEIVKAYMYAGNAYMTIRSIKTGNRFTFHIKKADMKDETSPWFVSVLNGPDNWTNYLYMGIIRADQKMFKWTYKSKVGQDALSWKAFDWLFKALDDAPLFLSGQVEVWHEGRCGMCGRKLTVPESIERGIGPDCATRM
jgi:hypothetical protein